jgi:hypothetical protein
MDFLYRFSVFGIKKKGIPAILLVSHRGKTSAHFLGAPVIAYISWTQNMAILNISSMGPFSRLDAFVYITIF